MTHFSLNPQIVENILLDFPVTPSNPFQVNSDEFLSYSEENFKKCCEISSQDFKNLKNQLPKTRNWGSGENSVEKQLFFTLMYLKNKISIPVLKTLLNISLNESKFRSQINKTIKKISSLYNDTFLLPSFNFIQQSRTPIGGNDDKPGVFAFADTTYVFSEKPGDPALNKVYFFFFMFFSISLLIKLKTLLYCYYKKRYLVKILVICAPNGQLLGVWGPFPGSQTDGDIFWSF